MWGRLQDSLPLPGAVLQSCIFNHWSMPRFLPNTRFSDCWSSVGDMTFYHRDGVCYFRKRAVCAFVGTSGQIAAGDVHRRALAAWRALDHGTQLRWNAVASEVRPHRPPFDGTAHITGHNLFVSAYHGFAQTGDEHIPEPVPWRAFPPFSVNVEGCGIVGEEDMIVRFKVNMPQEFEPNRYRLHTKIQLAAPGGGKRPGFMRMFVAGENCGGNESIVKVRVPDYKAVWGLDLTSYTMHCRLTLIDTLTGYRNDWIAGKFTVNP